MTLNKQQLIDDLRALGVGPGMTLMVHSALSAIGQVEGGAETVIEALIEALGPEGTLAMPAMSGGVFDINETPSNVGTVTEVFRKYPGVTRSMHPSHSACAIGPNADYLLEDSLDQPTCVGSESPWGRLSRLTEGYILLLGVDQDRSTILHYPEEIVRAPYLSNKTGRYLDEAGQEQEREYGLFPGPHRDFIGLEPMLLEGKAMKLGKVGMALCRLMHAGTTVELTVAALRKDPAAVLCDNPNCDDCVMQRAKIKAHDLAQHNFHTAALLDELADDLAEAGTGREYAGGLQAIWNEGIHWVELGEKLGGQLVSDEAARAAFTTELAEREMTVSCLHCGLTPEQFAAGSDLAERLDAASRVAAEMGIPLVKIPSPPAGTAPDLAAERLSEACRAATSAGVTVVIENLPGSCWDTGAACDTPLLALAGECAVGFAFNPAHFANVGEKPFLGTYRATKLKRVTRVIYASDGCVPGRPQYTPLVGGNAEVKELISIFRCRSFDGFVTLKMGDGRGAEAFRAHAEAFRKLLATS